ncbi:hypothetical protein TNCV_1959511 [Trichonephila clavipes]|nr:hypothetical protein TNCV_1959511 [Trichonephila clavipes]
MSSNPTAIEDPREERLKYIKSVVTHNPQVGMVWRLREWSVNSWSSSYDRSSKLRGPFSIAIALLFCATLQSLTQGRLVTIGYP